MRSRRTRLDYNVIRAGTGELRWIRICILSRPEITGCWMRERYKSFDRLQCTPKTNATCVRDFQNTEMKIIISEERRI